MSVVKLGYVFFGVNSVSPIIKKINTELRHLQTTSKTTSQVTKMLFGTATAGAAAYFAGLKALRGAMNWADVSGKFSQQLAQTGQILTATEAQVESLRKAAINVGLDTSFSPQQAMDGLRTLGELGFNAADAIKLLRPATDLAVAGQISMDSASNALSGSLRAFSMNTTQAASVVNKLIYTTQHSALQARDFQQAIGKGGATMAQFGQSFDDTLIAMSTLKDAFIDTSSASTAMRESARRMFGMDSVKNKLRELKVEILDVNGNYRSMIDIAFDVKEKIAGMDKGKAGSLVATIFGARGMAQLHALTLKGRGYIEEMRKGLSGDLSQVSKDFIDKTLDSYEGQKTILKGAYETLKVVVGDAFAATFKPIVKSLSMGISGVARLIESLPPSFKVAVGASIALAAGITTLAGATFLLIGALGGALVISTMFATQMIIATGIIGGIGVAAGLAAAGLMGLFAHSQSEAGKSSKSFKQLWEDVMLVADGVSQALSGDHGIRGKTLGALMKKENSQLLVYVTNIVRWADRAEKFLSGVWQGFKEGMGKAQPLIDSLHYSFKELGKSLGIVSDETALMGTTQDESTKAGIKFADTLVKGAEIGIKFLRESIELTTLLINNWDKVKTTLETIAGIIIGITGVKMGAWAVQAARAFQTVLYGGATGAGGLAAAGKGPTPAGGGTPGAMMAPGRTAGALGAGLGAAGALYGGVLLYSGIQDFQEGNYMSGLAETSLGVMAVTSSFAALLPVIKGLGPLVMGLGAAGSAAAFGVAALASAAVLMWSIYDSSKKDDEARKLVKESVLTGTGGQEVYNKQVRNRGGVGFNKTSDWTSVEEAKARLAANPYDQNKWMTAQLRAMQEGREVRPDELAAQNVGKTASPDNENMVRVTQKAMEGANRRMKAEGGMVVKLSETDRGILRAAQTPQNVISQESFNSTNHFRGE